MAGAFVAVADDATAAYWNPAGLATGAFLSLILDRAAWESRAALDAPGAGADRSSTFVGLSTNAVAFSYYRTLVTQVDGPTPSLETVGSSGPRIRSLTLDNFALTGAQMISRNVSVGTSIRYVRANYGVGHSATAADIGTRLEDAQRLSRRGENALDWDLGVKVGRGAVQVGFVARNLLQPVLQAPDGSMFRLERLVRAGVAVRAVGRLRVALDVDLRRQHLLDGHRQRNLAVGAEYWFGESLAVRGGTRVDLDAWAHRSSTVGPDGMTRRDLHPVGAFGFSVALTTGVYLDGQLTRGHEETERGWSLAGRVGF